MLNKHPYAWLFGALIIVVVSSISCRKHTYFFKHEVYLPYNDLTFIHDTLFNSDDYFDLLDDEKIPEPIICNGRQFRNHRSQQLIRLDRTLARHYWDSDSLLSVGQVVSMFDEMKELTGPYIGVSGSTSGNFMLFELLQQKASNADLRRLTDDSNPVTRSYAFWALTNRKTTDLYAIVLNRLSDTTFFPTLYGCIGSQKRVGDFFIEQATGGRRKASRYTSFSTKSQLSKIEIRELNKLILADSTSKLRYRKWL